MKAEMTLKVIEAAEKLGGSQPTHSIVQAPVLIIHAF